MPDFWYWINTAAENLRIRNNDSWTITPLCHCWCQIWSTRWVIITQNYQTALYSACAIIISKKCPKLKENTSDLLKTTIPAILDLYDLLTLLQIFFFSNKYLQGSELQREFVEDVVCSEGRTSPTRDHDQWLQTGIFGVTRYYDNMTFEKTEQFQYLLKLFTSDLFSLTSK